MPDEERTFVLAGRGTELLGEELPAGTTVGNYVTANLISSGGCGSVYRAKHTLLGRNVAVKVLRRDMVASPMAKRFFLEALAVNTIRHPNIVDVFEFGELPDGRPFYVMEFLEGLDLDTYLKRHGRFSPKEVLAIMEPVCEALEAAHKAGFVHRDIKPSNVHVGLSLGGKMAIKLLDFGVAKALNPDNPGAGMTVAGSRIGTSSTMAPEQILGSTITPQTDVYALGVLLFRLLVGRNPYASDDPRELDRMHLAAPIPQPSQHAPVPPALDAIVNRAMQKIPEKRYASAMAFAEALREVVSEPNRDANGSRVVGVYVSVGSEGDVDDAGQMDALACLDAAEARMSEAGLVLALQTGTALLGVKALPAGELERVVRAEAVALARTLAAEIAERPDADARTRVLIAVHAAGATLQKDGESFQVTGGDILALEGWAPAESDDTVYVTPEAARGL